MVPESPPESLPTFGTLLRVAANGLQEGVYARMAEAGFADLRPAHGAVFRHIPLTGGRATDLAARAGVRKQSIGALVDDLRTLGYVVDAPDRSIVEPASFGSPDGGKRLRRP